MRSRDRIGRWRPRREALESSAAERSQPKGGSLSPAKSTWRANANHPERETAFFVSSRRHFYPK